MKPLFLTLRVLSSTLVLLVALVFTIIEATLLITFDFALYENEFLAFVQLFLKLLLALSAATLGLLSIVKLKRSFFPEGLCLLTASAMTIPFMINNVGLYVTAVSAFFAISQLLYARVRV